MAGGYRNNYRSNYRSRYPRRTYRRRVAPAKRLVTGQTQPTMLEKIAGGIGSVANVAKAVLPMITAINTEEKFYDQMSNGVQPSFAAPVIEPLSYIATGTDESSRIGNSILARDINLRYSIVANYTTSSNAQFRMIVFVDKHASGVAPTVAQIFQDPAIWTTSFNKNFTDRYAILKDKRITLTENGNEIQGQGKFYKKLNFHIRYIGNTALVASAGNNQIYVLWWALQTTNLSTITYYSRLNFTDN